MAFFKLALFQVTACDEAWRDACDLCMHSLTGLEAVRCQQGTDRVHPGQQVCFGLRPGGLPQCGAGNGSQAVRVMLDDVMSGGRERDGNQYSYHGHGAATALFVQVPCVSQSVRLAANLLLLMLLQN
jgi:hypothetical protein